MFLLTFVLIIISMLSVYTQVYALEAARFLANQTSMGSTLVNWHATASNVAANAVQAGSMGAAGCNLTAATSVTVSSLCQIGNGISTNNSYNRAVVTSTYTNSATGMSISPPGYMTGSNYPYQWYSMAYTPASGGYFVLTYITPPQGSNNFVTTATGTQLNMTLSDIYRQLRNLGIPTYAYGYVQNNTLVAAPISIQGVLTPSSYPLPTGVTFPNGTLAIISAPGRCTTC